MTTSPSNQSAYEARHTLLLTEAEKFMDFVRLSDFYIRSAPEGDRARLRAAFQIDLMKRIDAFHRATDQRPSKGGSNVV